MEKFSPQPDKGDLEAKDGSFVSEPHASPAPESPEYKAISQDLNLGNVWTDAPEDERADFELIDPGVL